MLALKKIRGSCCLTAAAVFGFTLSALFTQSLSALTQDNSVSVQAVHSAAPQSGNSIIPASASQQEKLLRAVVSQLSLEEKAAQVLMVNIAGSKTADTKSIASFKGTVPGAVLLFGYNIADTPQ